MGLGVFVRQRDATGDAAVDCRADRQAGQGAPFSEMAADVVVCWVAEIRARKHIEGT